MPTEPPAAFNLPSNVPQFFFDNSLIAHHHHLSRRWMSALIDREPILVPDRPWEGRILAAYGTVLPDPQGGWRLYYLNFVPQGPYSQTEGSMFMARSADGFHWEKPDIGLVEYKGSKHNNIILHHGWHFDGPTILHEPEDADAPYKLMLFLMKDFEQVRNKSGEDWGLYGYTSKDALRWTRIPQRLLKAGDRTVLMPCKVNGSYVNFTRGQDMYQRFVGRVIYRTESRDFLNWSEPQVVLAPDLSDPPETEFYGLTAFERHGWYIGLLEYWDSLRDVIETHLVVSRDTKSWIRASRTPFIAATYDWNKHWSTPTSNGAVIIGDQMVFYFGGRFDAHHWDSAHQNGVIGWASIPIDRFCAIEALHGGVMETVPIVWPGGELVLNADTRGDFTRHPLPLRWTGDITVELLEASGKALPNWSGDEHRARFRGPNTHCRGYVNDGGIIHWPGGASMDKLRGQTIRIRFTLKQARLFTFEASRK